MKPYTSEYESLVAETKLCKRGIETAKKKYKKYPSAYANGYAAQVCKGTQPDNKGTKKKSWNEDLDKWFKEKWVDIGTKVNGKHPECGRPDADHPNRKYPKCVPTAKAAQMTKQEKTNATKRKRSGGQGKGKTPKYVNTVKESLDSTTWEAENGNKITLTQLLNAIKDYPVYNIPIQKIENIIIRKNTGGIETHRLSQADTTYPIIIVIDDNNNFKYVLDGNHRANKAIDSGQQSIPAKLINIKKLPQEFQEVLG